MYYYKSIKNNIEAIFFSLKLLLELDICHSNKKEALLVMERNVFHFVS
jgi:hypothetical protein